MGNKLGKRRQVLDEKYTRPQGLYQHKDVDIKKLRKLILDSKLAPCYPGDEDCVRDLEECPICFLYYPSLNRSRCCAKSICTECFLQMKTPNSARPTQCPFCKTSNYAVEYRGVKTKEEKGIEQIEEQRVIEAKIRMRQQEIQDDEDRMQKRQDSSSSEVTIGDVGYCTVNASSASVEGEETVSSNELYTSLRQSIRSRHTGDDEFAVDLEDVMVMEAIWLSIQENDRQNDRQRIPNYPDQIQSEQYTIEARCMSHSPAMPPITESSSSPSGGLACAIAALAERQQSGGESSTNYSGPAPAYNTLPGYSRFAHNSRYLPESSEPMVEREWHHGGSEATMVGTSEQMASQEEVEGGFDQSGGGANIVPESYEEQMMLAMAVSLAESRAMVSPSGVHGSSRY